MSFFPFSLLQHEQSQLFASVLLSLASAFGACIVLSFFFIGQESPLQQSQLSQHEAVSLPDESFFFIGQESPLQQQQDIADAVELLVVVNANVTIPSPMTSIVAIASIIFFFMI